MLKLTIIIPMYNTENYILRCLNSLLEQDLPQSEYEIVIINDGSTDNSLQIANNIAQNNPNIKIHSTKNNGMSTARNIGIKSAKGEYIFFVDADDYITSNSLSILINIALQNSLDLLGFTVLRTTDTSLKKVNPLDAKDKNLQITDGINYISNHNYYRDGCWWYFVKKQHLIDIGIEFYVNRFLQDTIFTAEIFIKAHRVSFIPLDVYRYVINPNSVWTNKTSKHLRKVIDDFTFITIKYNNLLKSLDNQKLVKRLEYNRDQMTLNIMKRIMESDLTIEEVKKILNTLKNEKLCPLNYYNLVNYKHLKVWFLTLLFKNEHRFLTSLFLQRTLKKVKNNLHPKNKHFNKKD